MLRSFLHSRAASYRLSSPLRVAVGVPLDGETAAAALAAQSWAGLGELAPAAFKQRLLISSSFYTFAQKQRLYAGENPVTRVERRRVQRYASAKAFPLDDVHNVATPTRC